MSGDVPGGRPRVLAAIPGVFPSTVINVAKPLLRLHQAGEIDLDLTFHYLVRRRQVERADVLVMSHTIDAAHAWILDCARDSGTPLLYDIDENLLEPPDGEPGLDFHRAPGRQAAVRQALAQAALVRTYAPALAHYLQPFNANVVRADGPVDWSLVPPAPPPRDSNRVHIVYATSRQEDAIGAVLVDPLLRILAEHAEVDVTIWGPRFPGLERHPRVRFREFVRDYDQYFAAFARAGFDIGLAPMPGDLFYRCKTATKFREYAACRIAGIYADTEMYRDCVTDGDTGLLASSDGWTGALSRLVKDAALRARIQQRAEAYARDRYAAARIEGDWLAHVARTRHSDDQVARTRQSDEWMDASRAGRHDRAQALAGRTPAGSRRQYAARAFSLLWKGGVSAVWARAATQLAGVRQLAAWDLALRRTRRNH